MQMFSSFYSTPLGFLKIQCSDTAVTSISFTETADDDTHPNELTHIVTTQLGEYFSGNRTFFDFPILQPGSLFQLKVWQLLHQIPYGKTISYMNLAKQYGDVKAIRAVAAANGKNNLAIVIPCHRVIGTNATLTGYAGGLWRKKWLLEHEAKFHSGVQLLPF
jgi:methylated-DNA-[protein]-cysteine S-methyltransferase